MKRYLESSMTLQHTALPVYNLGSAGGATGTVERLLLRIPGVTRVYVNPVTEMAYIEYDQERCDERQLADVLERAGYTDAPARRVTVERRPPVSPRPEPWIAVVWGGIRRSFSFLLGIPGSAVTRRRRRVWRAPSRTLRTGRRST